MSEVTYHIVVIVIAAVAVIRGYRTGLTGQVAGVLGFAFGVVSARVFGPEIEHLFADNFPDLLYKPWSGYMVSQLAYGFIYVGVYVAFRFLTAALRAAMAVFEIGILDSLMGAVFSLFKYMMLLSVAFNLLICINPRSRLVDYCSAADGNVVEGVVELAPDLMGSIGVGSLAHRLQLEEARKIS